MASKKTQIDTNSFIDAWEEEKILWDVNSNLHKNQLEKANSLKKLADQFKVNGEYFYLQATECLVLHFIDSISFLPKFCISLFFRGAEIKSQINTLR